MLLPDWMVNLLPAEMVTFFPSIFTLPFGALMEMPVKALIPTFPNGQSMAMARLLVDMLME